MRRNVFFVSLILTYVAGSAQDNLAKSSWVNAPVMIDGNAKDWTLPLNYYDADTKLFFSFANDHSNLYLCFQSPDEANQMKIMNAGMEISLSIKGKHRVSVDFPLDNQKVPGQSPGENTPDDYLNRKSREDSFLLKDTLMELKGFRGNNGMTAIHNNAGVNAAINWDESNKLTYEISIPLGEMFGNNYSLSDIARDITLEVTVNALKGHKSAKGRRGGSGMPSRGMGGKMGGGMHHQPSGADDNVPSAQPGDGATSRFEKNTLKQKFTLAESNNSK
jgi:hypothetical protein